MAKARNYISEKLRSIKERRDPGQTARTQTRMLLAASIYEAMTAKGISKSQFAEQLGQQPSVITKWLSGTHNFTVDTLTDIGRALNINLFNLEPIILQPQPPIEITQIFLSVKVEEPKYQTLRIHSYATDAREVQTSSYSLQKSQPSWN